MRTMTVSCVLLALASGCAMETEIPASDGEQTETSNSALIYGTDDRLEYGAVLGTDMQVWSDRTATVVGTGALTCDGTNCTLARGTYNQGRDETNTWRPLCPGVRFAGQPTLGGCSAFLVSPTTMVSAGHCFDGGECPTTSFVFGYQADAAGNNVPTRVPQNDVYACSSVVFNNDNVSDWAVITLDRPVRHRVPFNVFSNPPQVGDALTVTGHPMGLPMKISPVGGVSDDVSNTESGKLEHTVDTFGGNSGSPVIDNETGLIVAIHTNPPASHYIRSTNPATGAACSAERVCAATGCPADSRATRIDVLRDRIALPYYMSQAARALYFL